MKSSHSSEILNEPPPQFRFDPAYSSNHGHTVPIKYDLAPGRIPLGSEADNDDKGMSAYWTGERRASPMVQMMEMETVEGRGESGWTVVHERYLSD